MGCGESKHANVAAGNTVAKNKSSKFEAANDGANCTKDAVDRTTPENAKREERNSGGGNDDVIKEIQNEKESANIANNGVENVRKLEAEEEAKDEEVGERESLISRDSPNRYFSSRKESKDEDTIRAIVAEAAAERLLELSNDVADEEEANEEEEEELEQKDAAEESASKMNGADTIRAIVAEAAAERLLELSNDVADEEEANEEEEKELEQKDASEESAKMNDEATEEAALVEETKEETENGLYISPSFC